MAKFLFFQMSHGSKSFTPPFWGMGLFSTLPIAFILGLLYCGLANGVQAPSFSIQSGETSEVEKKGPDTAEKIWLTHRELLEKGEWEKSQGELEQLYQWKLNQGIRNHYPYAIALIRESQHRAQEGKSEAIPGLLDYAEKMAPDFSQVAYAHARWLWSQNPLSLDNATKVVWYYLQGVLLSFYNLEEALSKFANLSLWILLTFLITFVVFSFSLLIRYYSFFTHHLKHLLHLGMSSYALGILSILFLFLPFFLRLGWMWLFILWLLVFWVYGSRSDRSVIGALLVILLLLPTGIRFHSSFLTALTDNGVLEIAKANTGVWSVELHQRLLALKQLNPRDPEVLQAVGLVEKRMGKFEAAEENYRQWTQLQPNAPEAFNNLGNVYLATSRISQAMEAYQKAIQLGPSKAESHYNLGQAYHMNLLLKEADAEFQRAKELQPQLISYYTSISSRHPNRMVIDDTIDPVHLWRQVFTDTPDREKITRGVWELLWNGVPLQYGEVTVASLLVLLGLIHLFTKNKPMIKNCDKCGQLICSRCTRSLVIGSQCSQCITAFTARSSADPKVVKQKRSKVAQYQARRQSLPQWFSLILPGTGHLLRGHSKEGFIYLFIFILFLTKALLWRGWVPSPMILGILPSLPWMIVTGILFLVYYGFVQYRMIRFRSKGGKFYFRTA
jgi:tetratricopeptide (TPR) repeat protein